MYYIGDMKKRNICRIIFLISSIYAMIFLIAISCLVADYKCRKRITIHNTELYIKTSYGEQICNQDSFNSSAKKYFPEYELFPYANNVSDFCVFDGRGTLVYDLTYILELTFDNDTEFEEFVSYEHNRFSYTEILIYKSYSISIVEDDDIVAFHYKEKVPYIGGLLCISKEKLTIRYLMYIFLGGKPKYHEIFRSTNLTWE